MSSTEADEERTRARTPLRVLIGVLAVVVAALLVLTGVFAVKLNGASADESRRDELVKTARQVAEDFTTLDHRTYDEDTQRLLARASEGFRDRLATVLNQAKPSVTASKAAQRGKALAAGLVSESDRAARVLVVVDAEVTNAGTKEPAPRHYRLQVDLVREGDTWLASDLITVP